MTTLRYLYVDSVDCKTACTGFQIVKALNSVNSVKMTFVKKLMDALITAPALNDTVNIEVTCADATNVVEFIGVITKITPKGYYYEIDALQRMRLLTTLTSTASEYIDSDIDAVIEAVMEGAAEVATGLVYTPLATPLLHDEGIGHLGSFKPTGMDKLTLLKRLCQLTVYSTYDKWIFYQDGSSDTVVCFDRFGRPATGITLAVGTAIVGPTIWTETREEICNDIEVLYTGGSYTDSDATSIAAYGQRTKSFYAKHLQNSTDSGYLGDYLLYEYKNPKTYIQAKVRHDYLNTGTYYDVINATYSITDATIGKTAAGPYACVEHRINYPGFIDDVFFGSMRTDSAGYIKSIERRLQEVERW